MVAELLIAYPEGAVQVQEQYKEFIIYDTYLKLFLLLYIAMSRVPAYF